MKFTSLLGHLAELYRDCLGAQRPLDDLTQSFFAARRYLGRRDRAWLSDQLWPLLRGRLRWEAIAEQASGAPALAAYLLHPLLALHVPETALAVASEASARSAQTFCEIAERLDPETPAPREALTWWMDWATQQLPALLAAADALDTMQTGWPGWLARALDERLKNIEANQESVLDHIRAFQQAAPLTLRVNTLKYSRAAALKELAEADLAATPGSLAPDALMLSKRPRLPQLSLYRGGGIEVQDEGSQLIALALNPQPGWRVLDACAGGGGKSLHLAALMRNEGALYAGDKSSARLAPLRERILRAGAEIIRIGSLEEAMQLRDLDAVLIDAPCSGLGTLRRNPEMLWRVAQKDVQQRAQQQREILNMFAPCVRAGGVVVYATCSFLAEENDGIIAGFLETRADFAIEPVLPRWRTAFSAQAFTAHASLASGATALGHQLLPGLHGCDAFFISALTKTSA